PPPPPPPPLVPRRDLVAKATWRPRRATKARAQSLTRVTPAIVATLLAKQRTERMRC
ncbi:unnamed protein product, partial [Musa banksii]